MNLASAPEVKSAPDQDREHQHVAQRHGQKDERRRVGRNASSGRGDGRGDAYRQHKSSQDCSDHAQPAMQVRAMPSDQSNLRDKESHPQRHHYAVYVYQAR